MIGRKKPYTAIGTRRMMCAFCKTRKARHQWTICALNNNYVVACIVCDMDLNKMVLDKLGLDDADEIMEAYKLRHG